MKVLSGKGSKSNGYRCPTVIKKQGIWKFLVFLVVTWNKTGGGHTE
jgi:hypothetical protein